MTRRPLPATAFLASVVVVLVTALSACTDPNTMQVRDARDNAPTYEHESRLSR